jgi:hypothetical protein
MKKLLASIALGIAFSVASVSVYACADLITVGDQACALTGSGTSSANGAEICFYKCTTIKAAAPVAPNEE